MSNTKDTIHHPDRGVQYCSHKYTKILKDNTIRISMTKNSAPLENAVAERINKTLKRKWKAYYEDYSTESDKYVLALSN